SFVAPPLLPGTGTADRLGAGRPTVKLRRRTELSADVGHREDAAPAARLDEDPLVGGRKPREEPAAVRRPRESGESGLRGEERPHAGTGDDEHAVAAAEGESSVGRERELAHAVDGDDSRATARRCEEDDLRARRKRERRSIVRP